MFSSSSFSSWLPKKNSSSCSLPLSLHHCADQYQSYNDDEQPASREELQNIFLSSYTRWWHLARMWILSSVSFCLSTYVNEMCVLVELICIMLQVAHLNTNILPPKINLYLRELVSQTLKSARTHISTHFCIWGWGSRHWRCTMSGFWPKYCLIRLLSAFLPLKAKLQESWLIVQQPHAHN